MNKKYINKLLLLTILQMTFCMESSAGKKQVPGKMLSKKEIKALKAIEDAEFASLIAEEDIKNDKDFKKIIEERKQENLLKSADSMRHFFTNLKRKLQEYYVPESDVKIVEDGYRALLDIDNDISSRVLNENFIVKDQVFLAFFQACKLAISGSMVEVQFIDCKNSLQDYLQRLLNAMHNRFYNIVLRFRQEIIDDIHEQLILIISMQEEVIALLNENETDDIVAQNNLTIFRNFLEYIERK